MKTKDTFIIQPEFENFEDRDINIIIDENGNEYWSLNDLNKFFPERRLDNFKTSEDIIYFVNALESSIIPKNTGMITKKGKGGGTWAHRLIALRFAAWLSKDFEVSIYVAYDKSRSQHETWTKERALTKYEYRLMTDAIKEHEAYKFSKDKQGIAYAKEAMLINQIVFGKSTFEKNPRESATTEQLIDIKMLERYNATFIEMELNEVDRIKHLKDMYDKKRVSKTLLD